MQTSPKTLAIVGASGAVGLALQQQLAGRTDVAARAVVRRQTAQAPIAQVEVDFDDLDALQAALTCDVLLCALGTTQAKAGKAGLKAVDQDLVVRCARAAQAGGAARFVVVSALGASARSPSWYSRVKAAMEAEVQQLGFEAVHILRPSLLLGPRDEHRPGEALGQRLAPAINWALPPSWRAIDVSDVAGAMLETAQRKVTGTWVHELPLSESRSRKVA